MSRKLWKQARRHAKEIAAELDKEQRALRHLPRWRRLAAALGWRWPMRRWTETWERRNDRALARAKKKTTHFIVRQSRSGRTYRMRPTKPEKQTDAGNPDVYPMVGVTRKVVGKVVPEAPKV